MFVLWGRNLKQYNAEGLAAKLAARHYPNIPIKSEYHAEGAYNRCYKVTFKNQTQVIVRLAILGRVGLRKEKVENEVAVMAYLSKKTTIPVPRVLGFGKSAVGPYLVEEFVEGKLLIDLLEAPGRALIQVAILDPNVDLSLLKSAYRTMAILLLKLSSQRFPKIGALESSGKSGLWTVSKRPTTQNHSQLIVYANFPPKEIPCHTFSTSSAYFTALAEDHLRHLEFQRNDAIENAQECRKRYVARCLYRKIAQTFSTTYDEGPFPLICDDFRPSNVIVGEDLQLKSLIDLEFTYAGPVETSHCSPWWLLLAHPDQWDDGLKDFMIKYLPRHEVFLEVLRECEAEAETQGLWLESPRLSEHMARSLHNGHFWFCLAATSSFAFDDIYWKFIDEKHYGTFTSLEDRIALLDKHDSDRMEPFVQMKLEQMKVRKLDDHRTLDEMLET
ncbi:MAG: hypothetical protein Q9227_003467 [Pyrenula ochraceoflavens]